MIPQLYLYRLLRLVPLYYFVFLFAFLVVPFLADGPVWFTYERNFISCDGYWWSVFTMTINFFPSLQLPLEGCFFWGWIVAVEIQLFIFIPLLVWGLSNLNLKLRNAAIGVMFTAGLLINAYLAYAYKLTAGLLSPANYYIYMTFINKPYTKIYAVAIGLFLGFLFDAKFSKQKQENEKSTGKWVAVGALWALCGGVLLFVTTGNFTANQDSFSWTETENILWITFTRPAFVLAVSFMLVPIFYGYGKTGLLFLSSGPFRVLARLSFGAYLVFPVVLALKVSQDSWPFFLSLPAIIAFYSYNIFFCFFFAFLLHLFVEAPAYKLLLFLYGKKGWTGKHPLSVVRPPSTQPSLVKSSGGK